VRHGSINTPYKSGRGRPSPEDSHPRTADRLIKGEHTRRDIDRKPTRLRLWYASSKCLRIVLCCSGCSAIVSKASTGKVDTDVFRPIISIVSWFCRYVVVALWFPWYCDGEGSGYLEFLPCCFCSAFLSNFPASVQGSGYQVINFAEDCEASTLIRDNSNSFNNCVTLAASFKLPIYVPPGIFNFTKTISAQSIQVLGSGQTVSIFQWTQDADTPHTRLDSQFRHSRVLRPPLPLFPPLPFTSSLNFILPFLHKYIPPAELSLPAFLLFYKGHVGARSGAKNLLGIALPW